MTTLTELYNKRRTPVVPRPELATTPLVQPEIAGSRNPVAPAEDNDNTIVPQANVGEPQMTQYQWNKRFFDEYMTPPMTKEEEERRKKAASAATGIGHLGNVLSSFANLIFAGEAPSQKLPTVVDPKLQSFSDRLMAERQKYASGRLAAINTDLNNYQRALSLYRQDQARKAQNDLAKAKIAQSAAQFAIKNDREERKMKQDAAYKERELGIKQANLRSLEQYRTAKANGTGTDKSIDIIGENGKRFTLSGKDKDGVIAYMYKRMLEYVEEHPKENKSISDISWQFGEGGDQKTKQAAIVMSNIQNFPELYDEFDKVIKSGDYSGVNTKSIGWDNNSSSKKSVGW